MIDLSRFGEATDHGGNVVGASTTMRFRNRFVARKSDEAIRPLHDVKSSVIIEGDKTIADGGVHVARRGDRTVCGCRLIASLR
ncbi:PAAR motif protein [Caballeronia sp. SBC1]|uniref:PAAR domain-containing protein n=1 Tax=unclassified Caballeronia TaxID=2646786 RepID=UPI0013E1EBA7|nr:MULTISPECIES: PAAR domain-containing protein [unclassified Caballeronia]QIE24154.1 PAAR motif protein [Caballeronia sp. SBC2]QIN62050.1 PAAR motif protein [Caballeronia sp. SBC1]